MTTSKIEICSKCGGSGKVGFQVDNGVCYRCEGAGVVGGTLEERELYILNREKANEKVNAIRSIAKFLGKQFGCTELWEVAAYVLKGQAKEFELTMKNADLFTIPFSENYVYVHTCMNPSKEMLNNSEILNGKYVSIEKISEGRIVVRFN